MSDVGVADVGKCFSRRQTSLHSFTCGDMHRRPVMCPVGLKCDCNSGPWSLNSDFGTSAKGWGYMKLKDVSRVSANSRGQAISQMDPNGPQIAPNLHDGSLPLPQLFIVIAMTMTKSQASPSKYRHHEDRSRSRGEHGGRPRHHIPRLPPPPRGRLLQRCEIFGCNGRVYGSDPSLGPIIYRCRNCRWLYLEEPQLEE